MRRLTYTITVKSRPTLPGSRYIHGFHHHARQHLHLPRRPLRSPTSAPASLHSQAYGRSQHFNRPSQGHQPLQIPNRHSMTPVQPLSSAPTPLLILDRARRAAICCYPARTLPPARDQPLQGLDIVQEVGTKLGTGAVTVFQKTKTRTRNERIRNGGCGKEWNCSRYPPRMTLVRCYCWVESVMAERSCCDYRHSASIRQSH